MINSVVYESVRNGVCAVGVLTEPLTEYEQKIEEPIFNVIGTGFLVKENLVLTNRHVIAEVLNVVQSGHIPASQAFIQFVVPQEKSSLRVVPRMIREVSILHDPKRDLGFISYKTVHEEHFEAVRPLEVAREWDLAITEEVGVCGYAYGTDLLSRDHFRRWGPIIQQGYISAISPFDTVETPDEILLDVRTAEGMSGAPIIRHADDHVVGVHYAGIEATTAMGIPIIAQGLSAAFAESEQNRTVLNAG